MELGRDLREVEYAGYLLDRRFGKAESHPQFEHIKFPPSGYSFGQEPQEAQHVELITEIIESLDGTGPISKTGIAVVDTVASELAKVTKAALKYGATIEAVKAFFRDRNIVQNMRISSDTKLAFIPSVPFSICSVPWVVEIEDSTTLFFPYLANGDTASVDASGLACFPVLKALLESGSCKAIITHVKSTAESLPLLFQSEIIGRKVVYSPVGVTTPDLTGKKSAQEKAGINLLFTNSWHQMSDSFYLRGGLDVLEAFSILTEKYPNVNLIIRSGLPRLNAGHSALLATNPRITVLSEFLSNQELHQLMLDTDIYLVPAARLHVVSIVKALAYGLPVIACDGWGVTDYVDDGRNGFVIPGRYGVTSWLDSQSGMLKEDYSSVKHPNGANPTIVAGVVKSLSRLIEDRSLLSEMSHHARNDAETRFSLEQWNGTLKQTFDQIFESGRVDIQYKDQPLEITPMTEQSMASSPLPAIEGDCREGVNYTLHRRPTAKGQAKLSVILLNRAAAPYPHALDWLNNQTVPRSNYELIWLDLSAKPINPELYEHVDVTIRAIHAGSLFEHQAYNLGLLNAAGEIVCICAGESIFPPDFVKSVLDSFFMIDRADPTSTVLRHYEMVSRQSYPPGLSDLANIDKFTWLDSWPNVGGCMSVRKIDAIRFGGFDEHRSYQNVFSGSYDLGCRLVNAGIPERWHDRTLSLFRFVADDVGQREQLAADMLNGENSVISTNQAFLTGRLLPLQESLEIRKRRLSQRSISFMKLLNIVEEDYYGYAIIEHQDRYYVFETEVLDPTYPVEPAPVRLRVNQWFFRGRSHDQVRQWIDRQAAPRLIEEGYSGYNLVNYKGRFYALFQSLGHVDLTKLSKDMLNRYKIEKQCLVGHSLDEIKQLVEQQNALQMLDQETELLRQKLAESRQMMDIAQRELTAANAELQQIKSSRWFRAKSRINKLVGIG